MKKKNTKEGLIYCSTRWSLAAFMKIVAIFIQLSYPSHAISCNICSIALTAIVHLSIQAAIFDSAGQIINT